MASSFLEQVPIMVYVMAQLKPSTVLDIGKGFGKYAFLLHEYVGVAHDAPPDPTRSLKDQSSVTVDAVEIQANYMWPHIAEFYRQVSMGDIADLYPQLTAYDLVLMADVIEHLDRELALKVVQHFLASGSDILISTPKTLFHQDLYASEWEAHRSVWKPADFGFAPHLEWQAIGDGRIYLLSQRPIAIRGFGHAPVTRARRFARLSKDLIGL